MAKDFSTTPGPRRAEEGEFSGEVFLRELLRPRFDRARLSGGRLLVDLDGTEGYATSFLEAAFGGLARAFSADEVLKVVRIKSLDEPALEDEIMQYIREARRVA